MNHITIYTDGCCKGNPGPGGWGAVLLWQNPTDGNFYYRDIYGGSSDTTNNIMELQAAIQALNCLTGECSVELFTDSKYLKQGMTSWIKNWKRNGWKTNAKKDVANRELWEQLDALSAKFKVKWRWVKGHAEDQYNQRADDLANLGYEAANAQVPQYA
jgi:ribonuclease HI